ncbi:MFS transporter [Microbacterium sp. M28]|uniref:MFS transporter n=1 Tax=Microbacterium sp. M28 TaxID=2962064 RepID=UPI0021F4ED85|nr:MFS transporter [Microbacterium sp. M28]UYO95766.1 MFS transporter [Microbacterium sp. M28]
MRSSRRAPLPRTFTRIAWSSVTTQMAEQIALVAVPLAAVLLLGAGATETALLQVAQTLPFLVLALPFGLIIDRTSPRRVLLASELLRMITLGSIVVLIAFDALSLGALLALGLIGAIGTVGVSVAVPSAVPRLVTSERLMDANRWLELGRSAAFISGPILAGAIVSATNASTALVLATIACAAAAALLIRLDIPRTTTSPHTSPWSDAAHGIRYALGHQLLRPMILTSTVFNIGWFLIQSVFVVYALEHLTMTPTTVGITLGAYGAGMVIGAALSGPLSRRLRFGLLTVLGPAGGFIAAALMVATLWIPAPAFALASFFLFGLGPVLWTISTTSLRQAVTPAAMIGRVSSLVVVSTYGARPIGAGLGVVIAATVGMAWCIAAAVVVFALQLLVVLTSALPSVRELPSLAQPAAR